MKSNVGSVDRIVRMILGIVLIIAYLGNFLTGTLGLVLLIVGLVLAVTSVFSFCPLYRIFRISTNTKKGSGPVADQK